MCYVMTQDLLLRYDHYLGANGYSKATCQKYKGDLQQFYNYQGSETVDEETCRAYQRYLMEHYTPRGACSKIVAVNTFFRFADWKVRMDVPKINRSTVSNAGMELTTSEYRSLLNAAKSQRNPRLYYLIQILALTKISVSEHQYITPEAVEQGFFLIPRGNSSKVVVLPNVLRKELSAFVESMKIKEGPIFSSRTGKPWDRAAIHKSLKRLCRGTKIDPEKVTARNLTHVVAFGAAVYKLDERVKHINGARDKEEH